MSKWLVTVSFLWMWTGLLASRGVSQSYLDFWLVIFDILFMVGSWFQISNLIFLWCGSGLISDLFLNSLCVCLERAWVSQHLSQSFSTLLQKLFSETSPFLGTLSLHYIDLFFKDLKVSSSQGHQNSLSNKHMHFLPSVPLFLLHQ